MSAQDSTRTAALFAVLAVLLIAAPAQAARFSPDRQLAAMTKIGIDYWADRGLTHCQTFDWELADDFPRGAYGQTPVPQPGQPPGCYGWLDRESFNFRTRSRYTLKMRCTIVVHELGHANGLEHIDDGGIMDSMYPGPPRACRDWATLTARRAKSSNGGSRTASR